MGTSKKKRTKGKSKKPEVKEDSTPENVSNTFSMNQPLSLILTSESKRGLFHCDYCRTDISQVPRISCAVCPEFDLCLDCFVSTDPGAVKEIRANAVAARNVLNDAAASPMDSTIYDTSGSDAAILHHNETHGYRVADSTRFFMFPSFKGVSLNSNASNSSNDDNIQILQKEPVIGEDNEQNEITGNHPSSSLVDTLQSSHEQLTMKVEDQENATKLDIEMQENSTDHGEESINEKDANSTKINVDMNKNNVDILQDHDGCGNNHVSEEPIKVKFDEKDTVVTDTDITMNESNINILKENDDDCKNRNHTYQDIKVDSEEKENEESYNADYNMDMNEKHESIDSTTMNHESVEIKSETQLAEEKSGDINEDIDKMPTKPHEAGSNLHGTLSPDPHEMQPSTVDEFVLSDDPRNMWTVEEDLRLLEGIITCGLGNWCDVSEVVSSSGPGKSAKKCCERYFDDYLGRYGHILPPYIMEEIVPDNIEDTGSSANNDGILEGAETNETSNPELAASSSGRKRKMSERLASQQSLSQQSSLSNMMSTRGNKYRIVPTSVLTGYDEIWPYPYLPPIPGIKIGDEVGRESAVRIEQTFLKAMSASSTREEADNIRTEFANQMKGDSNAAVLPPRLEDIMNLSGSELIGFMPRRGDFDVEWDNDAEVILAEMEFLSSDSAEDKAVKLKVIDMYNASLDEREKRKKFLADHKLLDYRKRQIEDQKLPSDERDFVNRMRLFARFHSAEEHEKLINDLLKAKRLRKEITKLQTYRRMGITSLAEAERFELDRNRREFHKSQQREESFLTATTAVSQADADDSFNKGGGNSGYGLWKTYKSSDRNVRRGLSIKSEDLEEDSTSMIRMDDETQKETKIEEGVLTSVEPEHLSADNQSSSMNIKIESDDTISKVSEFQYHGLSPKEVDLCAKLEINQDEYSKVKKTIINESLKNGLVDRRKIGSNSGSLLKIDIENKENVIDFVISAGWVSSKQNNL